VAATVECEGVQRVDRWEAEKAAWQAVAVDAREARTVAVLAVAGREAAATEVVQQVAQLVAGKVARVAVATAESKVAAMEA
jgi:hypothetical protein